MVPHEHRIEEYNDAYFALLIDAVVEKDAAMLERLFDESQKVSVAMERRCLKTIARYFAKRPRPKKIRRVLGILAVLVVAQMIFWNCDWAVIENIRVDTLNSFILLKERYAPSENVNTYDPHQLLETVTPHAPDLYFEAIWLEWLPEGYQYVSGEYDYGALFYNAADEWIVIERFNGTATLNIDTENAEVVQTIEMNGNSGLCVVKNGQTHIVLYNAARNIFLDILAAKTVPRDAVEKFAKNVIISE